jgi:tetratricopeptide (TPR) repeat protein
MISKENSFDLILKWHFPDTKRYAFVFIVLFVSLIIIYGNSFHCAWQFDDFANIVRNENVHLKTLSWENIIKTFYVKGFEKKGIIRPLSYVTFALNFHIGGGNVFGFHVVNFAIHYMASIFLFLFIYNTLQLPILNGRYEKNAYAVALLSVFFWATHPIQVTAVTYIVQRMASMAGMFYIMAMYFYLKGRTKSSTKNRIPFFALCGFAAMLSFASKENAAMLPVSIFLYDLFLIQGLTRENVKKNLKFAILPVLIILVLGHFYVDQSTIFDDYKLRPFTIWERILTEPRVILFYISLLLYPINSRLTMLHDIEISRSLLTPWTTLPAIFSISIIIIIAFWVGRKRPLISFCIIFFFINHIIEGSVIPLELIFEHTNYLPSMFIFLPITILIVYILDYFSYKKSVQLIMSFSVVFLIAAQGHTTHMRNAIFKDAITLWHDNIIKSPNLHRPHHNLGDGLLIFGNYEEGASELKKALDAKQGASINQKLNTHYRLGIYYLNITEEYDKALEHFQKILRHVPNHADALNKIATIMFYKNDLANAEKYIKKAIRLHPDSNKLHSTLSLILLKKGDPDKAIKEANKGMNYNRYYLIGEAYRLKNDLTKSLFFFKRYLEQFPDQFPVNIALIEIYYLLKDQEALKQRVFHVMGLAREKELPEILLSFHNELNCLDFSRIERIVNGIKSTMADQSDSLSELLNAVYQKKEPGQ